ncbi:MAG: cation-translocating P-type ATPase [Gammaproteobacteria bacterium]|nr:cation-translocating P-type ATPase [Gammaproteobacteria bacterium]
MIKSLIAVVPAVFIFYLSYSLPLLISLSLFWQVALPLIVISVCIITGSDYLKSGYLSFKALFQKLIHQYKNKNKDDFFSCLNMNSLIAVSIVSSIVYAIFLGFSAPLVIYTAPLFTIAALKLSQWLKTVITAQVNKSGYDKLTKLQQKYEKAIKRAGVIEAGFEVDIEPNDIIPVDGFLLSGTAKISEGTFTTGESSKVIAKIEGERVYAGTYNIGSETIKIRAACKGTESANLKLIKSVIEQKNKPKFSKMTDKIAAIFIPVVFAIAALALTIWTALSGFSFGFTVMMDIIFAACPCALFMSGNLPFSILKAILFKKSIIIHDDSIIETLPTYDTIVFDKTGTLTQIEVAEINWQDILLPDQKLILAYVNLAERKRLQTRPADHFASAIVRSKILKLPSDEAKSVSDLDVKTKEYEHGLIINSKSSSFNKIYIGSAIFMADNGFTVPDSQSKYPDKSFTTEIYIALESSDTKTLAATIKFKQELRSDAKKTIDALKKAGIEIHMLTGDNKESAIAIANALDIKTVQANCTSKARYIRRLIKKYKKKVLVVGDGWNDKEAAGLANAGSVAMGLHSDMSSIFKVTIDKLSDLLKLKAIFKSAQKVQKQVFVFSVLYNLCAVFLAAVIFPISGMVTMMGCFGICMAFSSLIALAWTCVVIPLVSKYFPKSSKVSAKKSKQPKAVSPEVRAYKPYVVTKPKDCVETQAPQQPEQLKYDFIFTITTCVGCKDNIQTGANEVAAIIGGPEPKVEPNSNGVGFQITITSTQDRASVSKLVHQNSRLAGYTIEVISPELRIPARLAV